VLDGAVEIVEHSRGPAYSVTVHEPGEFTGDVDMLSGRVALVTGHMARPGQLLDLSATALRQSVDALPEFGEIVLKAFLARRALVLSEGFEGLKIIGSRFSPDAHRLRDFAARNAIPSTWIDLETSLPGVFAAGDVRSGSIKCCASAVGEGAMAVSFVDAYIEAAV